MTNPDDYLTTQQLAERCQVPVGVIKGEMDRREITPMQRRGKFVRWHWETYIAQRRKFLRINVRDYLTPKA